MRKLWALLLTVMLLMSFAYGCASPAATATTPAPAAAESTPAPAAETSAPEVTPAAADEEFKVAMLLPGTINDQGWNATAYNALLSMEDKLGATIAYTESVPQSDYEQVMRVYASQGFDFIIGHGYQFSDAAKIVAAEFQDVDFCISNGTEAQAPNLATTTVDSYEFGFVSGVIAGVLTQSKKVGIVIGESAPVMNAFSDAYLFGASYVDPSIVGKSITAGTLEDASKCKENALSLIDEGADVLTQMANQAGLGVINACEERGVLNLGSNGDQAPVSPDTVVTSVVQDMTMAIFAAAEKSKSGAFEATSYRFGVKDGALFITPFGNFEDKLPQEKKDLIADYMDKLASGEIDVYALMGL